MAKKRTYNVDSIRTEYEESLKKQEKRETMKLADSEATETMSAMDDDTVDAIEQEASDVNTATPSITDDQPTKMYSETSFSPFTDEYVNPDKEDYKRVSLFMDWDVWEKIQALCWSESEAVNKVIVDKLREWTINVPESTLESYRRAMKVKHMAGWSFIRDIIQFWWQTSGIRDTMKVQTYRMNRDSLTIIEENGMIHNYYIHRNWITDGKEKLARVKTIEAQLKRSNL